jgi:hypothetical protein
MNGHFIAVSEERLHTLRSGGPDAVPSFLFHEAGTAEPPDQLDVGKDWHALHFLLTGHPWHGEPPLAWAVLGGTPIGEELTYGPVHYLTPAQVAEVSAALTSLPREEVGSRFSPDAFRAAGINHGAALSVTPWPAAMVEYERQSLLHVYDELVAFYREAASRRWAVLKYLD